MTSEPTAPQGESDPGAFAEYGPHASSNEDRERVDQCGGAGQRVLRDLYAAERVLGLRDTEPSAPSPHAAQAGGYERRTKEVDIGEPGDTEYGDLYRLVTSLDADLRSCEQALAEAQDECARQRRARDIEVKAFAVALDAARAEVILLQRANTGWCEEVHNADRALAEQRTTVATLTRERDEAGLAAAGERMRAGNVYAANLDLLREMEKSRKFIEAVGLMSTAIPTMVVDADDPVGMAQKVVAETDALHSRLARAMEVATWGLEWAQAFGIISDKKSAEWDETRAAHQATLAAIREEQGSGSSETNVGGGCGAEPIVGGASAERGVNSAKAAGSSPAPFLHINYRA